MAADPSIGVDLRLDVSGDLVTTPSGDLALIGDVEPEQAVWQAVRLALLTTLGTYILGPPGFMNKYGTLLRQYIDEPMTAALKQQIETEVANTVLSDPRVQQINILTVQEHVGHAQGVAHDEPGYKILLNFTTKSSQNVGGVITIAGS